MMAYIEKKSVKSFLYNLHFYSEQNETVTLKIIKYN